jgi:hypothetical protein
MTKKLLLSITFVAFLGLGTFLFYFLSLKEKKDNFQRNY